MTQDQQRLKTQDRPQAFGVLGLRGDPSVRNGIFWASFFVVYFAVVASLSAGPAEEMLGTMWLVLAIALSVANYFLPRYPDAASKWGARVVGSFIPLLGVLVIVYARWIDPAGFAQAIGRS